MAVAETSAPVNDAERVAAEDFDPEFYRSFYSDLAKLSRKALRRHYFTYGRAEKRSPNVEKLVEQLEFDAGPLPHGFDPATYLALNPDLARSHAEPWLARAHYLSDGRREGRPFEKRRPALSGTQVTRSEAERLRRSLELALGPGQVDGALLAYVQAAAAVAAASCTPSAALMHPVLIARHRLLKPTANYDYATFEAQLAALHAVAFSISAQGPRRSERELLLQLRARATVAETCGEDGLPGSTLLMRVAEAASTGGALARFDALARFFVLHVPQMGLERYVTPAQRAQLRAPFQGGLPLIIHLHDHLAPSRGDPQGAEAREQAFWEHDVWQADLAYVLSSDQLRASQMRVEESDGERRLVGPRRLLPQPNVVYPGWAEREVAGAWLRAFVREEVEAARLSQLRIAPSLVAYLEGFDIKGVDRRLESTPAAGGGEGGRRLEPGELVTLADGGGETFLVGPGWLPPEASHRSTVGGGALIAVNLEEPAPLDLFISLKAAAPGQTLVVTWNGVAVAAVRPRGDRYADVHTHLGWAVRTGAAANILGVFASAGAGLDGHPRRLGLAVKDFMLVRR